MAAAPPLHAHAHTSVMKTYLVAGAPLQMVLQALADRLLLIALTLSEWVSVCESANRVPNSAALSTRVPD